MIISAIISATQNSFTYYPRMEKINDPKNNLKVPRPNF